MGYLVHNYLEVKTSKKEDQKIQGLISNHRTANKPINGDSMARKSHHSLNYNAKEKNIDFGLSQNPFGDRLRLADAREEL